MARATAKSRKLAVVKPGEDLQRFRDDAQTYREADEKVKLFTKQRDAVKARIKEFVAARGEPSGKSLAYIDDGIKWLMKGRQGYDVDAGVAAITEAIGQARGRKKQLLAACIVPKPTIDTEAWSRAKAAGCVSDELRDAYETGTIHALVWSHVDKARCPACDTVVTRKSKFCAECGESLT